ncbi:helix-turn-helix domain-containing protein [uncultured Paraburkholderia sp.]|uniref:ArsR/SmtB family transcription factor n=1 Tax=uncultured Paraburkholderia sp. TaxID=1822466 RepID=UPI002593AD80|nr:helix-turn-helix domain-containing protein [uncultured Paraburkholderia sp.]
MEMDAIFKALANPLRRRILVWLKRPTSYVSPADRMQEGATAAELQRLCGLAQSTVSVHLHVLTKAQLVTPVRVGQQTLFRRNEDTLDRLKEHAQRLL